MSNNIVEAIDDVRADLYNIARFMYDRWPTIISEHVSDAENAILDAKDSWYKDDTYRWSFNANMKTRDALDKAESILSLGASFTKDGVKKRDSLINNIATARSVLRSI